MAVQPNSKSAYMDSAGLFNTVKGAIIDQLTSSPYPGTTTGNAVVDKNIGLFMQNGYYTKLLTNMVVTNIIALDTIDSDTDGGSVSTAVTSRWTTVFGIAL